MVIQNLVYTSINIIFYLRGSAAIVNGCTFNVDITNSSGGSVEIEGKETKRQCCSNITVTSSRLKHSGLDCRKVSLNIVDSVVTRGTFVRFVCPLKLVEDKDTKAEKVIIRCDSCEEDEYKVSIIPPTLIIKKG